MNHEAGASCRQNDCFRKSGKKGLSINQSAVSLGEKKVIDKKQNEGHRVNPLCLVSFTLSLCSHFQR